MVCTSASLNDILNADHLKFAICCLPTAYFLLPTSYCLLPTAYYLLPTTYCLLPTY